MVGYARFVARDCELFNSGKLEEFFIRRRCLPSNFMYTFCHSTSLFLGAGRFAVKATRKERLI